MVVDVYSKDGTGAPIVALNNKPSPQRNIRVNATELRQIVAGGAFIRTPAGRIITLRESEQFIKDNFQ